MLNRLSLLGAVLFALGVSNATMVSAQTDTTLKTTTQEIITSTIPAHMGIGRVKVNEITVDDAQKIVNIDLKENYSYVPFTEDSIEELCTKIQKSLPAQYSSYKVGLKIEGRNIEDYIPTKVKEESSKERFITSLDPTDKISKGLSGDIIAMWQSHGWYFEPKLNRWEWQRARIFQTVEDLYTQSYVIPYLMPMLENAGAYVWSPRERDTNINELIIDNDGNLAVAGYEETTKGKKWKKGNGSGFAYERKQYEEKQNPFVDGTFRQIDATKDKRKVSTAQWNSEIPEDGTYAVYISYKTLPNSTKEAEYTINYAGGQKKFKVNQTMGGGTWVYLGHFPFVKGKQLLPIVELSNLTSDDKTVITADAVKIGGGYGNIARIVKGMSDNTKSSDKANSNSQAKPLPDIDYQYQISNHPRYTEGARYFMQWAGIPDSVYSPSNNVNDYTDDYRSRGIWVNYLAGGSSVLPANKGLNIPVNMAFAFHSDAGTTMNDSIIGTLGIYFTNKFSKYVNGTPRIQSRKLTNLIMTNIVNDIRKGFEPNWVRRGMWDQSYYEARVPEVPTMLLELLSHQNFADMKYGLDPNFRFTVSRAIYKGMLQFLAEQEGRKYVIQPLPINSFAISKGENNEFILNWKATQDTLSKDAQPTKYYVMERIGGKDGFKNIATTRVPTYKVEISDNNIHCYQIIAANDGGKSFPSETLALGVAKDSKGDVLVVNGFTRISAPDWFDAGKIAGFYDAKDHGVPYVKDISFIGSMFEYRRDIPWMDDDAAGFGASRANYETKVIAGNTFDYPYLHGSAIMDAGYSFVSSSVQAINDGGQEMNKYKFVDLILGKQKETIVGRGAVPNKYKAFPKELQKAITSYCNNGGNLFISGAYVASDIWDNKNSDKEDIKFAENVLGYKWRVGQASVTGEAFVVPTIYKTFKNEEFKFSNELNKDMYVVESPDSFYPADDNTGSTFMRYKENNLVAGVLTYKPTYKVCVIGFPFETIKEQNSRNILMEQVMEFLNTK